ncbi:hypothetical protein J4E89_008904 [Alternaria sp. Ai002NY15]|nr:hypothetical protein J4E89_008904 [Alternaria sp. Ai002NY15]
MRLLSNVASRRFAGITATRKLSSTSNGFMTRPGANLNIDAHAGGPRYRNFSTSNKALDGFAFNPFTKTLPFRKPLPFFSAKCLEIKDADFAWFTALNVAVRTHRNRVYLSHPDCTPRLVLHDYQHTLRVVADAEWILRKEQRTHQWARDIDSTLLWVLCMTHDITHDMSDAWYLSSDEKRNQWQIVREFLRAAKCPPNIIWQASCLAARLSSSIQFDEQRFTVTNFSHEQPIHRILRDAYHLQRLGAVGVARYFYFHGMDEGYREPGVGFDVSCLRHMHGGQYVERMTTETGAEMAHKRYMWTTHKFLNGWDAENDVGSVVTGRGFR